MDARQVYREIMSDAMAPTLPKGRPLVVDRYYYHNRPLSRWDVVVFCIAHENLKVLPERVEFSLKSGDRDRSVALRPSFIFCKRILGLPTEQLDINDSGVRVNGVSIDYPYDLKGKTDIKQMFRSSYGAIAVPSDAVFLISDNPEGVDSREFGPIPVDTIVGRVVA